MSIFLLAVPRPLRFLLFLPLPCSLTLTLSLLLLFFLLVLDPHFEDLGRHFSSILAAFGHPWNHFGRHWAPLGQPCGPKGENRELREPTWPTYVPIWCPFGSHFFTKITYFTEKNASHNNPTIKSSLYVVFFAISVTLGP